MPPLAGHELFIVTLRLDAVGGGKSQSELITFPEAERPSTLPESEPTDGNQTTYR